jgi:hypothetical protein
MCPAPVKTAAIPDDIRSCSRVIIETNAWLVGIPLNPLAMYWWGAFTEWCVAADAGVFADYADLGCLIVFRSRTTRFRWALHSATGEFRNSNNRRASWSGFLMRNPDVAAGLMKALAKLDPSDPLPLRPLVLGLSYLIELVRQRARGDPIATMHLEEMEGAAMRALDYVPELIR